jgi:hypothetical protein
LRYFFDCQPGVGHLLFPFHSNLIDFILSHNRKIGR